MTTPVDIPDTVWRDRLPFTPAVSDIAPGLALAFGTGRRGGRDTVVASIAFNLPDALVDRYRGQTIGAVHLVAQDLVSGDVYAAACVGQDRPPAAYDPGFPPGTPLRGLWEGGTFNVDLVDLLGLPATAGRYLVCAWLDEITSAPKLLDLPAAARPPSALHRAARRAAGAVQPAPAGANGPALAHRPPGQLAAQWRGNLATAVSTLGVGLAERQLRAVVLAAAGEPAAREGLAVIDATREFGLAAGAPAAWLLLACGQVRSLVVPRI
jgi:hypothetical protein